MKTNQAAESSQNAVVEDHQVSEKGDEKWDKIADKKDKANEQKDTENSDQQNTEKEELQVIVED